MNSTLARLHSFDPAVLGLADFGRGENYVARQIERWSKQYQASQTEEIGEMEELAAPNPDPLGFPDAILIRPTTIVVFDSVRDEITIVTPVRPARG